MKLKTSYIRSSFIHTQSCLPNSAIFRTLHLKASPMGLEHALLQCIRGDVVFASWEKQQENCLSYSIELRIIDAALDVTREDDIQMFVQITNLYFSGGSPSAVETCLVLRGELTCLHFSYLSLAGWENLLPEDGLRLPEPERRSILLPRVRHQSHQPVPGPKWPQTLPQRRQVDLQLPGVSLPGKTALPCVCYMGHLPT